MDLSHAVFTTDVAVYRLERVGTRGTWQETEEAVLGPRGTKR
jgi:hypothetical protein